MLRQSGSARAKEVGAGGEARTLSSSLEDSHVPRYITPARGSWKAVPDLNRQQRRSKRPALSFKLTARREAEANGGSRTRVSGMARQHSRPAELRS